MESRTIIGMNIGEMEIELSNSNVIGLNSLMAMRTIGKRRKNEESSWNVDDPSMPDWLKSYV